MEMEKYCKILIVEDELIMRQGIKYILNWEKEGFQLVGEAQNGEEGLRLVEELKPHIVLLDVVMPLLNGIEFSEIIHEKYPDIQFIILSGYDNFEYVKTTLLNGATDYLLKPTINPNNLLLALQRAAKKISGMQLVKSDQLSIEMQLEKCLLGYQNELLGINLEQEFPYSRFRLAGINLKQMCQDEKDHMLHMEEMIRSYLLNEESYKAVVFMVKKDILCYLFNYRVKEEELLLKKLEFCMGKIANRKPHAFAVLSESFIHVQDIKMYYQKEVLPIMGKKFYYADKNLLIADHEIQVKREHRFAYETYNNYLMHGKLMSALAMFLEYVEALCVIQLDEYRLKNLTKNLLYQFLIEAERHGISGENLCEEYFEKIDHVISEEEFQYVLDTLVEKLKDFQTMEDVQDGEKIGKMRAYIAEHYGENLTLTSLADSFGFSYHYLSYYFNKQAKEGFSEYLNKIRIGKACEMLKENTYSISEISRQIGYSDHAYFCRVFKKITGQTPSNYRRMQKVGDTK